MGHDLTPAMLQPKRTLILRRLFALSLCAVTLAAVLFAVGMVFSEGGIDALEWGIIACVALSAPWTILGSVPASPSPWPSATRTPNARSSGCSRSGAA
jgi:hypothetical protein